MAAYVGCTTIIRDEKMLGQARLVFLICAQDFPTRRYSSAQIRKLFVCTSCCDGGKSMYLFSPWLIAPPLSPKNRIFRA